jgi:hypothetical protein
VHELRGEKGSSGWKCRIVLIEIVISKDAGVRRDRRPGKGQPRIGDLGSRAGTARGEVAFSLRRAKTIDEGAVVLPNGVNACRGLDLKSRGLVDTGEAARDEPARTGERANSSTRGTVIADGETVAVKVTDCPGALGLAEEVTLVVVLALFTTCGFPVKEPVLPLKFPSPP